MTEVIHAPLEWTSDPPTEVGIYVCRTCVCCLVVNIQQDSHGLYYDAWANGSTGSNFQSRHIARHPVCRRKGVEWFGPLPDMEGRRNW